MVCMVSSVYVCYNDCLFFFFFNRMIKVQEEMLIFFFTKLKAKDIYKSVLESTLMRRFLLYHC